MAWKQSKKRPVELSAAEKEYVRMKLEEYKTKFFKPFKGEVVYKVEGDSQEVVETARFKNEDDISVYAKSIVDRMNKLDKEKRHWVLVSTKTIGQYAIDDEESRDEASGQEA